MAKRHGLARAVRMRHAAAAGGLAAVLAATALWLWSEGGASTFPVAYVVCGGDYRSESRAYRVDLLAGQLTDVSEPVSPDGRELYVSYGGLYKDSGAIMQVWDADTGEVLRGMPTVIESHYEWSADGAHVAEIWPGGDRESVLDGKVIVKKRKGGVSVRSALTGEKLSLRRLEDNKGMHPPWGRIEEPLIYLFY